MKRELVLVVLLAGASTAKASYIATSQIEGNVCKGFGIEFCRIYPIAGVKGKDGRFYTIKTEFRDVDDYNEGIKRCWINTKSKGAG